MKVQTIHDENNILRQKCEPAEGDQKQLVRDLLETIREYNAVGCAAPQLGVNARVAVVQIRANLDPIILINPEIVGESTLEVPGIEECLSVPGVARLVMRAGRVTVKAQNLLRMFSGLTARAVQHEIDHLDGILITDKGEPVPEYKRPDPVYAGVKQQR